MVGKNPFNDTHRSYVALKDALRLCAGFRGTYLDHKVTFLIRIFDLSLEDRKFGNNYQIDFIALRLVLLFVHCKEQDRFKSFNVILKLLVQHFKVLV